MSIAEFAYNNIKNANINHILFELNYGYDPRVSFKDDINFCSKLYSTIKLVKKLRKLMDIY